MEIPVSNYDSYPPGRVTDLSVVVVNDTAANISIVLKWTAPGDDLDEGTGNFLNHQFTCCIKIFLISIFRSRLHVQFRITSSNIRMSPLM